MAQALGRPIRYRQITPEEFVAGMRAHDVPTDIVDLLHELFTVVLGRRHTQVMHGVAEALGRPARDFSAYVRKTVSTGVWSLCTREAGLHDFVLHARLQRKIGRATF